MTPRSRGHIHIRSSDPGARPALDHRFVSDAEGYDAKILTDGIRIARELGQQSPLREFLGAELDPLAAPELIAQRVEHYYHPVGSCKMGPASDPAAVVDPTGRVHGLENAFVADCSICPVVPRANTNVPAVVIGLRVAQMLLESGA